MIADYSGRSQVDTMEEPSVLDYLKSKLAFWKHSSIEIPAPQNVILPADAVELSASSPTVEVVDSPVSAEEAPNQAGEYAQVYAAPDQPAVVRVANRPIKTTAAGVLLALGALVIAFFAQSFLEPPNRAGSFAAFLYILSAVMIGAAYFNNLVLPSAQPADAESTDSHTFHIEGLIVGSVLLFLAFLLFYRPEGKETSEFNFFNTSLWLLGIGYLIWSFYLPRSGGLAALRPRIARFFARPTWKITVSRWALLLLAVIALALFFRFYHLDSLPANPVSDHAEKLLDVNDVLHGEYRVFFPRNTGREAFQFYWTALMVKLFNTGVTFFALKLGTTLIGLLTLYYVYRLGLLVGNRWVALLAVTFCAFSYWANIQSRIGLRFPLYPGFLAPMLYYMIRGLRQANRNDFIWAGLWMGIGLQGYTAYRIVPLVAVVGFLIYFLHQRLPSNRRFAILGIIILAFFAFAAVLPLFRFAVEDPKMVLSRSMTRISTEERALPGPPGEIFAQNTWNALMMFFWGNGDVWVHSIPNRPALDVTSAALFALGLVLVVIRYVRKRSWTDLFLLLMIPILLLPSILALAFPNENPNLNRTAGAYIPVFLILAIGLEALLNTVKRGLTGRAGTVAAALLGIGLIAISAATNFDLVFNQYDKVVREMGWNTGEMGEVVRQFDHSVGRAEDAWVVAYPYWVDTRLVGIAAGYPTRDMAINPDAFADTKEDPRTKLFILNLEDQNGLDQLKALYPDGKYWQYQSRTPGKDFFLFMVPPRQDMLPEGSSGQQ